MPLLAGAHELAVGDVDLIPVGAHGSASCHDQDMGKRSRRRSTGGSTGTATVDYADAEGNVLTLRETVSAGTAAKLRESAGGAAASGEDVWRRRTELLFERYAVRWVISGLPLEKQKDLLARYRMADQATQQWVRETIDGHVAANPQPGV
jgi:hypothetical protein